MQLIGFVFFYMHIFFKKASSLLWSSFVFVWNLNQRKYLSIFPLLHSIWTKLMSSVTKGESPAPLCFFLHYYYESKRP
jgi:hypothetical protein